MSRLAVNPAVLPHLSHCALGRAIPNWKTSNSGGELRRFLESIAAREELRLGQTSAARAQMKTLIRNVSAVMYPAVCWVTRFGAKPAPCGTALFCFGYAALRVTVSVPDPP